MTLFVRSVYIASGLSLGYILLLYRSHPHRRIPTAPAILVFVLGMLAVVPVVVIRRLLPIDLASASLGLLLGAAAIEEGCKFLAMAGSIWRFRFPDLIEPLDVAIYFGILGVGFGIYEDFWYVFSLSYPSWIAGDAGRFAEVFRGVTLARAFPGHILFDALAGFLIGYARFRARGWPRVGWWALAVGVAVFAHAAFNCIGRTGGVIPLLTWVVALLGAFLALRKRSLAASPFPVLIAYIDGARAEWPFRRSAVSYLFAEGFDWPGKRRGGLFQFYPLLLSLLILFPLLVMAVYLLNRVIVWPFGPP